MIAAVYVAVYAALSTAGLLLLRSSLSEVDRLAGPALRGLLLEPRFVGGLALYVLSFGTWLLALRRWEVVQIFPVFVGAGFCGVVLGGALLLDEALTGTRIVGAAIVLLGIVLLLR